MILCPYAEFTALCEAVTDSLRLSGTETAGGAASPSESPDLRPLSGDTYYEQCAELEAQRSYGTNAQIDDSAFSYVTVQIRSGDARWREDAERVSFGGGLEPTGAATRLYKDACEYLERMDEWAQYGSQMKYTQTPLYELAQYRYKSAVLVWGIN